MDAEMLAELNMALFNHLESAPEIETELRQNEMEARAAKVRGRINARRASSEAVLAEILPEDIADGESWHVISSGDVDSLSFLAHLIKRHVMDYVAFSTWCMALDDANRFSDWVDQGRIIRLDGYVGEIFPNSYAAPYEKMRQTITRAGGRLAVFRNHCKVYLCRSSERFWVIESSANINTNPRTENTVITSDSGLFWHHKAYFDGIKSFVRDFDDWKPA